MNSKKKQKNKNVKMQNTGKWKIEKVKIVIGKIKGGKYCKINIVIVLRVFTYLF